VWTQHDNETIAARLGYSVQQDLLVCMYMPELFSEYNEIAIRARLPINRLINYPWQLRSRNWCFLSVCVQIRRLWIQLWMRISAQEVYIIALHKSKVLLFSLILLAYLLTYNHETTVAHKGVPVEAVSALQKNLYTWRTAKCIFWVYSNIISYLCSIVFSDVIFAPPVEVGYLFTI